MDQVSAFNSYDKEVQRWIYNHKWKELRLIQEKAAAPILSADKDVIISAATASGKTEAAFLPAISHIKKQNKTGFRILYVSPLKALINDQYNRLLGLCDMTKIVLTPWHGDVPEASKTKQKEKPEGILMITPESLDSRLFRDPSWSNLAFKNLDFIIIDEFHAFLGNERGYQLLSLMTRIDFLAKRFIPRIALSATLSETDQVFNFLRPHERLERELIEDDTQSKKSLRLIMRGFEEPSNVHNMENNQDEPETALHNIANHLFDDLRKDSHLIFCNSRKMVETLSDALRQMCEINHLENEFFPHHGNIDKHIREDLESRLRAGKKSTTAIATSTLELGIDIGSVRSVVHFYVAPSVSSLKQRLGRSGRKPGDSSILKIMIIEKSLSESLHITDRLRVNTVQSMAMIRLLLDKWVEPPPENHHHFSTLLQQTLSVISQYGSVTASQLWNLLCSEGPFRLIDQKIYKKFLSSLGEERFITQTHSGAIVLGDKGEKEVNRKDFCLSFKTNEEYTLRFQGRVIGTIPISCPTQINGTIIFAGRRWIISKLDAEKKIIELEKSISGKAPRFGSGGFMLNGRIREEMFNIYKNKIQVTYLDKKAKNFLSEGIDSFHQLGLDKERIIQEGGSTFILPWCDDRIVETIGALLRINNKSTLIHRGIIEVAKSSVEEIKDLLQKIIAGEKPTDEQLCHNINPYVDKFDWALSDELRIIGYAKRTFDTEGAWQVIRQILSRE